MKKRSDHIDLAVESYGNVRGRYYSYAVLPWGSTEPHNYHLPYLTDCYLARAIALEAVRKASTKYGVRGMILPAVTLGAQNPGQRELPFCIHARYETQKHILTDITGSLREQGMRILVIVNGHGGNSFKPMIRDLAFDFPDMLIVNCDWFAVEPRAGYFDESVDDHAGEEETSTMLHFHPELVDLAAAGDGASKPFALESLNRKTAWVPRDWSKVTTDTGVGDPRRATAEKGAKYAGVVTDRIAALFHELVTKNLYEYPY